eukprot:CAMPEP_0119506688 /NCGR_PEP_ID=MMETSP1344-20130328/26826_1 /TAXON_ID=236787 /ORGANISM="Florenciella parvula, Strain CCMP2471" /LENGTH=37 /DNA_ID= /DNA_START= /DNA_END= /DNA_ORIENTATION=
MRSMAWQAELRAAIALCYVPRAAHGEAQQASSVRLVW